MTALITTNIVPSSPNMKLASRKILALDRRLAAVHEAGHVVVARRLGLEILSAWITPGNPEERSWVGRVQISRGDAPKIACQMVGVAGSVAEWLWEGREMEDYIPGFSMSESDLRLAGCPPGELWDAAAEVGKLFDRGNPGWRELITEARRLIVDSWDVS